MHSRLVVLVAQQIDIPNLRFQPPLQQIQCKTRHARDKLIRHRRCFYELRYPGCPSSLGDVKIGE